MKSPFDRPWVSVLLSINEFRRFCRETEEQEATGAAEIRLDLWHEALPEEELKGLKVPVIFTWRKGVQAREAARRKLLKSAARGDLGPCWIDLDRDDPLLGELLAMPELKAKIIASVHLQTTFCDSELQQICADLQQPGVAAMKVVLQERALGAVRQALRFVSIPCPIPLAVFVAGVSGSVSRLLAIQEGSAWSYGRLPGSPGSDPGQPVSSQLQKRFAGRFLHSPPQQRFAVLGSDVRRSLSPAYHNALLDLERRDAQFLDISLQDPGDILASDESLSLAGLAVTAPHKKWARATVPPGPGVLEEFPSWNTLMRDEGGEWWGTNTDGPAVVALLEDGSPAARRVAILGGGGTALAAAVSLRHGGHDVALVVRAAEQQQEIQSVHGFRCGGEEVLKNVDALINATGAGRTAADPLPWNLDLFRGHQVLEVCYEPLETEFLRQFKDRATCTSGAQFFSEQARRQAKILYGAEVSREQSWAWTEAALQLLAQDPL
ncbi:MAG: type I 3-dehydroquinate dehydratase [Planctomycetota bacterium]